MRCKAIVLCALALLLILGILAGSVAAQGSPHYNLTWNALTSGGGTSSSPHYGLSGSLGQGWAGVGTSGNYRLGVGYWYAFSIPVPGGKMLFLPFIEK